MAPINVLGGLVFALCLLVPLTSAKTVDVNFCSSETDYAIEVKSLEIDPFPITKSKKTTFQITASTDQAISGGKLVIDVSYLGIPIHSEDHNLCDETICPVSVGDFNVTHAQSLPWYTPPGSYSLEMNLVDGQSNLLTCITFGFSIGFVAEENNLADM